MPKNIEMMKSIQKIGPLSQELKAWQAALAAFQKAAGKDPTIKLQWTIAWTAAMNAIMAYVREMNPRENRDGPA